MDDGPLSRLKAHLEEQKFSSGPRNLLPADAYWLVAEVERLRDRVFELKIYEGFGQDHGHQRCVAEIGRLQKALAEEYVQIRYRTDPAGLEERLDRLMDALVEAGVPDADIAATLSTGEVTISAFSTRGT